MAQSNVYSLNVVGYINIPLVNGANAAGTFNLIANQLDLDGTGVNNTLTSVLGTTGWASGTAAYGYNTTSGLYESASFNTLSHTWGANAIAALAAQPGNGIFLKNGNAGTAGPTSVTVVGNVLQGGAPLMTRAITVGYQVASSKVPQAGLISTDLGLAAGAIGGNSVLYQFNSGTQLYSSKTVNNLTKNWPVGGEPTIAVGEAFFLKSSNATNWTRNFTVQ